MNTDIFDLTLEIRSADGSSTEFYQTDEERIRTTLRLLATPRLFTQPQLLLASEHGVSTIPCRGVDMLLARTSGQTPLIFPLIFPAGLLDIMEVPEDLPEDDCGVADENDTYDSKLATPPMFRVEMHTMGGWKAVLKVLAMSAATAQDQRQAIAHVCDLALIPFRLADGGIGFINPANITRATTHPVPDALPGSALPMDLLRWMPRGNQTPFHTTK